MRFDGTLKSWNAERGFGFITPRTGGQDIFIHISAFPRDGRAPREGEALSFEVESTPEGKKRATRVQRPGAAPVGSHAPGPRESRRPRPVRRRSGFGSAVIALTFVAVVGWFAYDRYAQGMGITTSSSRPIISSLCDGRTHCSQMTSCAEAKFFLKNCPGVQMDGNGDGVPCEKQWCTGFFAK